MRRLALLLLLASCSSPGISPDAGADVDADVETIDAAAADAPDAGPPPPPRPPPWDPPIGLEPEVGWRDGTGPICGSFVGAPNRIGARVWADARGVFVFESIFNNPLALDPPYPDGASVHFNDGSGWVTWLSLPNEPGSMYAPDFGGVAGGPLFVWGGGCALQEITGPDEARCVYSESVLDAAFFRGARDWFFASGHPQALVHVVDGTAATLATLDARDRAGGIWADDEDLVVLLDHSILSGPVGGPLSAIAGAPAGDYATMNLAGAGDVWLGAFQPPNLHHYDGTSWETVETGLPATEAIWGIWRDGGTIYFITNRQFARYTPSAGVETIFDLTSTEAQITSLSGDSSRGEVYLSVVDRDFIGYACGPTMLVVYDGSTLHRF